MNKEHKKKTKHKILLVEYKTYKHTYKYKRHPKYVCHFFVLNTQIKTMFFQALINLKETKEAE